MVPRQQLLSHRAEAVAAVDGTVTPREERHHGIYATLGADRRVHLPRSTAVTSAATAATAALLATASTPAGRASAGLIGETLLRKELLFTYRENEG